MLRHKIQSPRFNSWLLWFCFRLFRLLTMKLTLSTCERKMMMLFWLILHKTKLLHNCAELLGNKYRRREWSILLRPHTTVTHSTVQWCQMLLVKGCSSLPLPLWSEWDQYCVGVNRVSIDFLEKGLGPVQRGTALQDRQVTYPRFQRDGLKAGHVVFYLQTGLETVRSCRSP